MQDLPFSIWAKLQELGKLFGLEDYGHAEWLLVSLSGIALLLAYLLVRLVISRKVQEERHREMDVRGEGVGLQQAHVEAEAGGQDAGPGPGPGEEVLLEPSPPSDLPPVEEVAGPSGGPAGVTEVEEGEILPPAFQEESKESFLSRLRGRLGKTQDQLIGRLDKVLLGRKSVGADVMEALEEVLMTADLGVKTGYALLDEIQNEMSKKSLDSNELRDILKGKIHSLLDLEAKPFDPLVAKPFVIMVVGVNGVGKTTTIGKLAARLRADGRKVLLVAADTFRAAAIEQLEIWGKRVGADLVKHSSGADPSAVVFDGLQAAVSRGADVVIIDTAGRLHTKKNLMEELKKIKRIIGREQEGGPHEILLVLDATMGQNAIHQAAMFNESLGVSGIALTKLDGTAKGGVIVGISHELRLPVRFIGIGESIEDLKAFDPEVFVDAIFGD